MNIYDQMVAEYQQQASASTPNVEQEVMQKIALAGLSRGGFFKHAAFYGGTCLRLFHQLPRYSEAVYSHLLSDAGQRQYS